MTETSTPRGRPRLETPQVVSLAAVVLLAGLIVWRIARPSPNSPQAQLAVCRQHMEQIRVALEQYRRDHGDYPIVLTSDHSLPNVNVDGLYPRYIRDPNVFLCPAFKPRYFRRGALPYSYNYQFDIDPTRLLFPTSKAQARAQMAFNHQLLQRFGRDTTLLTCPAHDVPAAPAHALLLAQKVDGRQAWESMKAPGAQEQANQQFMERALAADGSGIDAAAGGPPAR
jgi:hypothetical protein